MLSWRVGFLRSCLPGSKCLLNSSCSFLLNLIDYAIIDWGLKEFFINTVFILGIAILVNQRLLKDAFKFPKSWESSTWILEMSVELLLILRCFKGRRSRDFFYNSGNIYSNFIILFLSTLLLRTAGAALLCNSCLSVVNSLRRRRVWLDSLVFKRTESLTGRSFIDLGTLVCSLKDSLRWWHSCEWATYTLGTGDLELLVLTVSVLLIWWRLFFFW